MMRAAALSLLVSTATIAAESDSWRAGGPFAGVAAGAAMLSQDHMEAAPALALEGRAGFIHPWGIVMFASGSLARAELSQSFCFQSPCQTNPLNFVTLSANLEYRLVTESLAAAPFLRATFGYGFGDVMTNFANVNTFAPTSASGIAWGGSLGVEWPLARHLALAPEMFFRNSALGHGGFTVVTQAFGAQVGVQFY